MDIKRARRVVMGLFINPFINLLQFIAAILNLKYGFTRTNPITGR